MGPYELIIIISTLAPFAVIYYFIRHKIKTFNIFNHPTKGYIAVKVGFSFPAMFFHHFWMLFKGLSGVFIIYLFALGFVLIIADAESTARTPDLTLIWSSFFIYIFIWIYAGIKGNDWISKKYLKQGCSLVTSIKAKNKNDAVLQAKENEDLSDLFINPRDSDEDLETFHQILNEYKNMDGFMKNKRTRIAIVVSIGWGLFSAIAADINEENWAVFVVFMIPVLLYWGYRFIKGN